MLKAALALAWHMAAGEMTRRRTPLAVRLAWEGVGIAWAGWFLGAALRKRSADV